MYKAKKTQLLKFNNRALIRLMYLRVTSMLHFNHHRRLLSLKELKVVEGNMKIRKTLILGLILI